MCVCSVLERDLDERDFRLLLLLFSLLEVCFY